MNLKELHPFRMGDAIRFHDKLNPKLWWGSKMLPRVRLALLNIAEDFVEYLGVDKLKIKDITISGSNAAYTYTPHSDIDLHIVVDVSNLNPDGVYQELFRDKKQLYNEGRKITVHGIPVECYVQDSSQEHVSLGEYSIQDNKWIKFPTKTRSHYDETATKLKYEKLRSVIERAIKTGDSELIDSLLKKIKQYRSAGLSRGGEFSPENLAYKAVKAQGAIDKLYKLRDRLRGRDLSIENMYATEGRLDVATPGVKTLAKKYGVSVEEVERQVRRGIKIELEHTSSKATARQIALDHLGERLDYYKRLAKVGLEETTHKFPELPSQKLVRETKMKDWWTWRDNLQSYLSNYDLNSWETPIATHAMNSLLGKNKLVENVDDDPLRSFLEHINSLSSNINTINIGDTVAILRVSTIRRWRVLTLEILPQARVLSISSNELIYTSDGKTTRAIDLELMNDTTLERGVHIITDPDKIDRIYTDVEWYQPRFDAQNWHVELRNTLFETLEDRVRSIQEASGYIPSPRERHDPRFKTALTVDVNPYSIQDNARRLGMKIARDGRPPLLRK